jgi:hypothetical protein
MNLKSWERIFKKHLGTIKYDKKVIVIINDAEEHVQGIIKDMDKDFIVIEDSPEGKITAIIELEQVAGFRFL